MKYCKEIIFPYDLNGRAAQQFMQTISSNFFSSLYMEKDVRKINAHSLLGLLSLGVKKGDKINFYSENEQALDFISEMLKEV